MGLLLPSSLLLLSYYYYYYFVFNFIFKSSGIRGVFFLVCVCVCVSMMCVEYLMAIWERVSIAL